MFVAVHHEISDAKQFWSAPEEFLKSIPSGLRLHASYPNADGSRATCLWECGALPKLREFIEKATAGIAKNEYMPLDESRAFGLPKKTIEDERAEQRARA
jgi:hypothetical protein